MQQFQLVLRYSYTYDMIFITYFLKSNANYTHIDAVSALPLSPAKYSGWTPGIPGLHKRISLQTDLCKIGNGLNGTWRF